MTTTEEAMIGVPEYITDLSRRGLTRGMAELDSEGLALKNPDPILGETYLLWSEAALDDTSPVFIATYCGEFEGERLLAPLGYITRPRDEVDEPEVRALVGQQAIEDRVWVKARFDVVPITDAQMDASHEKMLELRREQATEQTWFEDFGDGLNELAENNRWCSTYDEIVRAIGLPGRKRNFWVSVSARVTVEDNSPSGALDDALESHYGAHIETTYAEFRGTVRITVHEIEATDSSSAESHISEDDVKAELNDVFSGSDDITLDDWEVIGSGEEED
jgi:hypothetical protein